MTVLEDTSPRSRAVADGDGENAADAGSLADMSPREAQDALAERLGVAPADEDGAGDPEEDGLDTECDGAATGDDEGAPVFDAAERAEHARLVEALLFASAEPMTAAQLARRLPHGANVAEALEALTQQYESRGVVLQNAGGLYRFVTNPDIAYILQEERVEARKLSRAALETLAVIAYHQPCTRADIEDVRGVAVSKGSLDQLLEVGWIRLAGKRKDTPGRPSLYATTSAFLAHFDLASVGDLPGMADLKAAGLLDANLPPNFSVPMPKAADENEDEAATDDASDSEAPDFVQDFHGDEASHVENADLDGEETP